HTGSGRETNGGNVQQARCGMMDGADAAGLARKVEGGSTDRMPSAATAPSPESPNFQVRRPDTLQFSTIDGLCRMAGVGQHRLRRLIAKEVVDNALDECDRVGRSGAVTIAREGNNCYIFEDQGGG